MARLSLAAGAALAGAALSLAPARLAAQTASSAVVTPNPDYGAGWLHRVLLGSHYRDLWTTPIAVDRLDLDREAGGLRPTACGGGRQTKSVRFRAADDREYAFRSVDKDPSVVLPEDLRRTFAREVLQDQISSGHPAAPLVVAPLLEAAGVLHAEPRMALLPDDPRLAPLPCARAGMLGMLEERPTERANGEAFAGAADLASTRRLLERIEENPAHRVAAREFLTARLLDVYVGDWDRHADQWRWARFDDAASGLRRWRPIPRDRDQAFARLDGFLPWLSGYYHPELVGFDDQYPSLRGLTWTGRAIDRRFLAELERSAWDSVAGMLQRRLTDSVIDAAVRRLPPEYYAKNGPWLGGALRARRDHLPEAAARYYALLARTPEIHGTDEADEALIERLDGGRVRVTLRARGQASFGRTFEPRETEEIRLFLHGGADRLVVRGAGGGPVLRVIGGGGDDLLADSARGGSQRFYDDRGTNRFIRGPGTSVDVRPYTAPPRDSLTLLGPSDQGSVTNPISWLGYSTDLGVFLGGGFVYRGFGFRRLPYKTRWMVRAGWGIGAARGRAEIDGEFRGLIPPAIGTLYLRASGIEALNFYGFGNETDASQADEFYKLHQQQYVVEPGMAFETGRAGRVWLAAALKHARTETEPGTFVTDSGPYYGSGDFTQIGIRGGFRLDTRDLAAFPTRGFYVDLVGAYYFEALDVVDAFATGRAEAATYLSLGRPAAATLALRVGAGHQSGTIPFQEMMYLGGARTVRGYPEHRFAGGPGVWGNAELRIKLFNVFAILPGELGVLGLADAGRVYLESDSSDVWHAAGGGGVWLSFLNRRNTLVVALAQSPERTGLFVRAGFMF